MAELTDEARQQIELEVRRLLEQGEARRQNKTTEQLNLHRDFLVKNTKWVVSGFFGLLLVFGALITFIFGSQLDHRYLDAIINDQVSETLEKKISFIANQESQKATDKIQNTANSEKQRAIEEIGKVVVSQTQDILTNEVTNQIESVKKSFAELDPLEIIDSILVADAVMAFDRPDGCPTGWSFFREAGGRMILGAGQHRNIDQTGQWLKVYPSYADDPQNAVGGEEQHSLTEAEMPSHSHIEPSPEAADGLERTGDIITQGALNGEANVGTGNRHRMERQSRMKLFGPRGNDAPHNNMPPYIALHFCKYGGTG